MPRAVKFDRYGGTSAAVSGSDLASVELPGNSVEALVAGRLPNDREDVG